MRRSMVALAAGMALPFSVSAQLYKWMDPGGKGPLRRPPAGRRQERTGLRGILRPYQQIGVR
jgi:hypothetical protein